jgi:hypothetical protein
MERDIIRKLEIPQIHKRSGITDPFNKKNNGRKILKSYELYLHFYTN